MQKDDNKLIVRDWLAIERTKLANERTFLAYFRTSIVLLATGLTLIKVSYFSEVSPVGYILLGLAPLVLIIGVFRIVRVKKWIGKFYEHE